MEPTQIGRALGELGILWIAAHSPQAKGRVERSFQTDQDRLVKDPRMASVTTLDQANLYLEAHYLPWWQKNLTVEPRRKEDVHRPLEKGHDLAAILSRVESRIVKTDYPFQFEGQQYVIERADIRTGLRGATVRVEKRRDGTLAVRFQQHYLRYGCCESGDITEKPATPRPVIPDRRPETNAEERMDGSIRAQKIAPACKSHRHLQCDQLIHIHQNLGQEQTRSQKDARYREASSTTGCYMGRVVLVV